MKTLWEIFAICWLTAFTLLTIYLILKSRKRHG